MHKNEKEIGRHEIDQPKLHEEPKEYHRNPILNDKEHFPETIVISVTVPGSQQQLNTYATELDSNVNWRSCQDTVEHLICMFRLLHNPLVKTYDEGDVDLDTYMDHFLPLDMKEDTCPLLHRCIHALATQELIYDEPNSTTLFRRQ